MPNYSRFQKLSWSCAATGVIFAAYLLTGLPSAKAQGLPGIMQEQGPRSVVGTYPLYSLSEAKDWINSKPLTAKQLKGKVVLVDFWAYSCINCLRSLPYVEAWAKKYKDNGLVVIGVHTPEFDFGKNRANVQKAVQKLGLTFPIALDSDRKIWNAFHNQYWPADYFLDAHGKVRYEHFGEGNYAESEQWIRKLLADRSKAPMAKGTAGVQGEGVEQAADWSALRSPETYIGYDRAERFRSPGGIKHNAEHLYATPHRLGLNDWGLAGNWIDRGQNAVLKSAGGKIIFRFHARDLNLVLGPAAGGKPVRFRVTIDGREPGENHGVDTDTQGSGVVKQYRLYQLVRQKGDVSDHTFEIEFLDSGIQAFAFTFG
jgi:thiol-disulfide isomerase/thioredoxin